VSVILLLGLGVALLLLRPLSDRVEFVQGIARTVYRQPGSLLPARLLLAIGPLMGLGVLLSALAAALPRPLNGWAALPATVIIGLATVASYRLPAQWLPGWMRAEIDDGRLPIVRPDKIDWVLLVLFGLVYVVGVPSLIWVLTSGASPG
jgi:hypothetical protein